MRKIVKISTITKFGNVLARTIQKNLVWSRQLRKAVRLHTAKENGDVVSITISVGETGKDKSGMPLSGMARAFEYGSGIHGKSGSPYPIVPRRKEALWFYLDNPYPNAVLYEKDGKIGITTKKVMHPGVMARPYILPAIQEVLGRATDDLALDIRRNIIDEFNITIREINNLRR